MGRKKKYIEMFGSFTEPYNYGFSLQFSCCQLFISTLGYFYW